MAPANPLFKSFLHAGFECSTHTLASGKRLDLLHSTRHDELAYLDYSLLGPFGMKSIRSTARWHRIEATPGSYDFHSLDPLLNAASASGIEVLLDLLHFGWPDHLDIFQPSFLDAFDRFTLAVARHLRHRSDPPRFFAPVNEISYLSWGGGDMAYINPFALDRGHELKHQLVRAYIRASDILLNELPACRLISPEPVIHIVGDPAIPGDVEEAHHYTNAQYQAWDLISGRLAPELGGGPQYLDIVGINFYAHNQWIHNGDRLLRSHPSYRPLRNMLQDVSERYNRPLYISETGSEDDERASWYRYIVSEVTAAVESAVPVHGLCLYPILNHPGWVDDRHCHNGLFDYADDRGRRPFYEPLAEAILESLPTLARLAYLPAQSAHPGARALASQAWT